MSTEKKGRTYSTPTLLAEQEKKCWELVQLTSLTFKAMILTVVGIALEQLSSVVLLQLSMQLSHMGV